MIPSVPRTISPSALFLVVIVLFYGIIAITDIPI